MASNLSMTVVPSEDPTLFTDAGLAPFAVIVFLLNSEPDTVPVSATPPMLNQSQQQALASFFAKPNRGYVGIHSARSVAFVHLSFLPTSMPAPHFSSIPPTLPFVAHPLVVTPTFKVPRSPPCRLRPLSLPPAFCRRVGPLLKRSVKQPRSHTLISDRIWARSTLFSAIRGRPMPRLCYR